MVIRADIWIIMILRLRIKEGTLQDLVVFPFEEKLHTTLDVKVWIIDLGLQILCSNEDKSVGPIW